jgi:hypothetical protein
MNDHTAAVLRAVEKKLKGRAVIDAPDELDLADVLKIAQRKGFDSERARYVHLAAICIEQAARHAAIEEAGG